MSNPNTDQRPVRVMGLPPRIAFFLTIASCLIVMSLTGWFGG
jgi:hypothetical protein